MKALKALSLAAVLVASLSTTSPALASGAPSLADVSVSIAAPAGVSVGAPGLYRITVANPGKKVANDVQLVVTLPATHTSPQTFVMGTLSGVDSRCNLVGTNLNCSLGALAKSASTQVNFTLALPQSSAPEVVAAGVTTSSTESSTGNNNASVTASLLHPSLPIPAGSVAVNSHCTGTTLTAYFECTKFPSSISSHTTQFLAGGAIAFVSPAAPGYTGTWNQTAGSDRLHFEYSNGTSTVATFDGWAVSSTCFEGITTFPGSSYVSPYQVCLVP